MTRVLTVPGPPGGGFQRRSYRAGSRCGVGGDKSNIFALIGFGVGDDLLLENRSFPQRFLQELPGSAGRFSPWGPLGIVLGLFLSGAVVGLKGQTVEGRLIFVYLVLISGYRRGVSTIVNLSPTIRCSKNTFCHQGRPFLARPLYPTRSRPAPRALAARLISAQALRLLHDAFSRYRRTIRRTSGGLLCGSTISPGSLDLFSGRLPQTGEPAPPRDSRQRVISASGVSFIG
jgi:hypothetical protein